MKRRITYLLACFAFTGMVFTQCTDDPVDTVSEEQKAFMTKTTYGVYSATDLFVYSESGCQYVLGVGNKSTRVQTDDVSKVFSATFSTAPAVESEVEVQIAGKGISGIASGTVTAKVLDMKDGKIWIWDAAAGVGYLLPWN